MKKLIQLALFASLILGASKSNATHYAGAEMFYEHVAGTARDYHVTLIVYGDLNGAAALPITEFISYTSSCNAGGTVNNILNSQGAQNGYIRTNYIYDDAYPCAPYDPNDPNSVQFYSFTFEATITLPTNCNDWVFSWSGFARNNAISNIQGPGGRDLYIEARLNNNLGQNSSPRFTSAPVKQFCVKQQNDPPFPLVQSAIEIDGDSIFYELANPQEAGAVPIPFAAGYSLAAPISSWTLPTIDQATATFFFTPDQPDVDVLKIEVSEYRFDSNSGNWVFVGSTARDLQIPILTSCNSNAEKGPAIDTLVAGFTSSKMSSDTLEYVYGINHVSNDSAIDPATNLLTYNAPLIEYNCFDDLVTLIFQDEPLIYTPSISDAKDEFRIIGPDGVSRPVLDITFEPTPGSLVQTKKLFLKLHKPLDLNGTYVIQIKRGSDGNTLQDECGFQLPPNQIMLVNVENCPQLDYSLDLVTVEDDRNRRIKWSIDDPAYLQPSLFNYWNIGMKVGGNQYSIQVNDINAREYLDDSEFFKDQVDHQNYEYSIQLVQNADFKKPAEDEIVTILLEDTIIFGQQSKEIQLAWNAYNGFDSAAATQYELFLGTFNAADTTLISWASYQVNNDNYFSAYQSDETTPANDGLYGMKVEATNVNDPNSLISESNWIFFLVKHEPLPDISLVTVATPNVISPNNDNVNDRFFISGVNGGREYSKVELTVYNRWGQLVYENNNFAERNNSSQGWDGTDIYSGQTLSDGVYYYVAKLQDPLTGTSEDLQGSVTILGSEGSK